MSSLAGSFEENEHHEGESKKSTKQPEVLEEGVSRVEPSKKYGTLISILTRVLLAALFLGFGVGAVYYSVAHSEEIARAENEHSLQQPHRAYFKFTHDQSYANGTITIERSGPAEDLERKNITKLRASWLQDNANRRLVHKVWREGSGGEEWKFTYFVYDSYSVLARGQTCIRVNLTYEAFLDSFGLSMLPKVRQEHLQLTRDSKPATVELYQGLAVTHRRENSEVATGYREAAGEATAPPFLATAFTQPHQGLVYGWQVYFPTIGRKAGAVPGSLLWMEYWFPNMTTYIPDASVFFDYPIHCLATTQKTT